MPVFSNNDILNFYRMYEPGVKTSTVNWRIYHLVQSGVLNRIGRGKFKTGSSKIFVPENSQNIVSLNKKLNNKFPFLIFCIWNTSVINEFMVHQPGRFYSMVEVEKNSMESVFYFLKEKKYPVFLEPGKEIINKYVSTENNAIIIKPLISEAPVQNINGITTITIEKMLVDIFCDMEIFSAQQGSEMENIFTEATNKYTVSENRLLRYADRRRKKTDINRYLETLQLFGK